MRALARLVLCIGAGFAGAAAGSVIHQLRTRQQEIDAGDIDIVVAAPPITAAVGAGIGLLFGGPLGAFLTAAGVAAFAGTTVDEKVVEMAGQLSAKATSSSQSSA